MGCRLNGFFLALKDELRFFQEICMLQQGAGSQLPVTLNKVFRNQETMLWQSFACALQEGA